MEINWSVHFSDILVILAIAVAAYKFHVEMKQLKNERKFKISQSLLEKNLDAMEKAYEYLMEINKILHRSMVSVESAEKTKYNFETLLTKVKEVESWYHANRFRLPKDISEQYILLLQNVTLYLANLIAGVEPRNNDPIWETYRETYMILSNKFENFLSKYNPFNQEP